MYLPATYSVAIFLCVLSMVSWGSWANTYKLTKGYRFELFYWDYLIGLVLLAIIAGLTLGSSGTVGFKFFNDVFDSSRHNQLLTLLSGVIFGAANLLLVAAVEIAGLAVAFPVGIGLALIIGAVGNYIINPKGNPLLLFGGVVLVAGAIVMDALAYRVLAEKNAVAAAAGSGSTGAARPSSGGTSKGLILSLACGLLMGLFYPFYARASYTPANANGVGPYGGFFVFVIGTCLCTLFMNGLWFMRKPVSGAPVRFREYFKARASGHWLGILGGVIWGIGGLSNFIAGAAGNFGQATAGPAVSYALGQGATMVSAIWGVFVWHEFRSAGSAATKRLALMFVLFAAGLGLIAIAPLH